MAKDLLIDVRSSAEYQTGFLEEAINIEFTNINQLATLHPETSVQDSITLYCRSGRRSAIALDTLQRLGYQNVRDIGSLENATEVLRNEKQSLGDLSQSHPVNPSKQSLAESAQALLDGLRGLE